MDLVNVKQVNNRIKFNIKYATKNNFINKKLYKKSFCLLKKEVALAINKVQLELEQQNLGLIIWDAYRPPFVQKILKSYFNDENFISSVSNHSKGISVDVSLCDNNKIELNMPTEFDNFSKKAHSNYLNLDSEKLKNRAILKRVMEKHGFKQDKYEWWHFDFISLINSPIIENLE